MLRPQVEALIDQILSKLPRTGDLDLAIQEVVNGNRTFLPDFANQYAAEIAEARSEVERQFENVEILHKHSILAPRPQWYFGPRPTHRHWPALKAYLLAKNWTKSDVEAIDEASNDVVSLLANPNEKRFDCRGMVVGHVQSGKTANMTAVMSKALDAGYNTVIVLAGLTNKLRYQTQIRMFNDLVKRNLLDWQVLTPNDEFRDFRAPPQGGFLAHTDKAQIAVIKKNVSPLGQLKIAIKATNPEALRRLRILVIDDECDQATVNAGRGEFDVTAINGEIRKILELLPAVSYIGYTATPFANVLIDPYRTDVKDGLILDDLYPRDFISALPASPNYFGTEKLFGRTPNDPENINPEEEGLDMIRDVPAADEKMMQPPIGPAKTSFAPEVSESLQNAILYFLACCAVRRARGDCDQHMTMLVHTSAFIIAHDRVAHVIRTWVEDYSADIVDPESEIGKKLVREWGAEKDRLPQEISAARKVSIEEIFAMLPAVIDALEFPIENGVSDDRITYEDGPKTYIAVGGSILARGLTLEGLMVSYFLRSAKQYDTLLQMGRWFGYRPGYEDLPRIWMPDALKQAFRNLARVEMEIRQDIERYRVENKTPSDIAVRIRSIPGMAITGATKMRAARTCAISYWGTHRQTFRFHHRNKAELEANWSAGTRLLEAATERGYYVDGWKSHFWRGVPKTLILDFLKSYSFHPNHADLQSKVLEPFLEQSDTRLSTWNIAIVEPAEGKLSAKDLGPHGPVRTVRRSKLKDEGPSATDTADIKALMSKADVWLDREGSAPSGDWDDLKASRQRPDQKVPLLLMYPIDRVSEPKEAGKTRVPLDAASDMLGLGIVFPGSISEGASFVSVMLTTHTPEDLDEMEAEEAADVAVLGGKMIDG
jgi:hypothetical protein